MSPPLSLAKTSSFPVLYNSCYGGFGYSAKAVEEYNKRLPAGSTQIDVKYHHGFFTRMLVEDREKSAGPNAEVKKYVWNIERHDPLMVQVCTELGAEANGEHAEIAIQQVQCRFKNHYCIGEYDGHESVSIDFQKYQLDKIKCIVNDDSISSDVKVKMTSDVLLEVTDAAAIDGTD